VDIIKLLLDEGANIFARDSYGKTALDYASGDARQLILAKYPKWWLGLYPFMLLL